MKKDCSCGKHAIKRKNRKINKKKIVLKTSIILVSLILFVILGVKIHSYNENIKNPEIIEGNPNETNSQEKETNEVKTKQIVDIDIPDKQNGYKVIGQLGIEKINLKKYIINKTTNSSLKVSITKLYGPEANKPGNLCIIGHNLDNFFSGLKKLKVDDTFYIIDKETHEKVTYKINKKYTVIPTDLSCLKQNTDEKREVTLITCNPRRVD